MSVHKSILVPQVDDFSMGSKMEKKIKTSGLDNFREKLLAGGISKNVAELITIAKRQGSITLYELTWDSCCSRKQVNLPSGLITYFFS